MHNSNILYLEYRLRKLEHLCYKELLINEGKKDQEILNNFLGDEYYDKYNVIKSKIKDPEYKDIYKMIKKDPDEVKDYIDNFQSNTQAKRDDKESGAKLIYNKDGWKVYRITTYQAARLYGKNTKWCISGNYPGHEDRGQRYFDHYIETGDLDDGYYFYIKGDDKYCLLRKKDGNIDSIWLASDKRLPAPEILQRVPDFPSVPDVFDFNADVSDDEKSEILSKAMNKCKKDLFSYFDLFHNTPKFGRPVKNGDVIEIKFNVVLYFSKVNVDGKISLKFKTPNIFDFKYECKSDEYNESESGAIDNLAVFESANDIVDEDDYSIYEDFQYSINDLDSRLSDIIRSSNKKNSRSKRK